MIKVHLVAGEPKEVCRCLKGWYSVVENRALKPCYNSMANETAERDELYWKVSPLEEPIPINVESFKVDDSVPEGVDIRTAVTGIQNGGADMSGGIEANT